MAIQTQPPLIPKAFATSGDKNVVPEYLSSTDINQSASWNLGFPQETGLPVTQGGIPPSRKDFNGIFNILSGHTCYQQQGGIYQWASTVDYDVRRLVMGPDGKFYVSIKKSGPDNGGSVNPQNDASRTTWQEWAVYVGLATNTELSRLIAATAQAQADATAAGANADGRVSKAGDTMTGLLTANGGVKGDLAGNADTATVLKTSRNINGTAFNGSGAITTAKWGTARNIHIADADGTNSAPDVSVDGSASVILSLPSTIKATLTGTADQAVSDASGNAITTTYSTKTELANAVASSNYVEIFNTALGG